MTLSILLALTACQQTIGRTGTKTSEFFPMDGDRQATYVSEDETVTASLNVEKIEPSETIDDLEVVTFEYSLSGDSLTIVGAVKWSAAAGHGIKIHAWSEGPAGEFTVFDSPILVTNERDYANVGEVVTTTTNGYTFTSTFVGFQDCPVQWGLDWEGCLHLTIDDGDGDPSAGPFFAGDYWLVTRYGPAWMKLTGNTEKWNLIDYDWDTGG